MVNSDPSARCIKHFGLPLLPSTPGPIHTIVEDGQGNIYYSDEFNHSVVSLNSLGELRWDLGTKGHELCQFWYPQGISLGWIGQGLDLLRCLAVCDSWNRRVQFFDLDGLYLTSWNSCADAAFSEIADIRFIPKSEPDTTSSDPGFWLILDRSNHCLYAITPSGELLFRIGRHFNPNLTTGWTQHLFETGLRTTLEHSTLDILYYPTRILGNSEDMLFVWEPLLRKLKMVIGGSLFPLSYSEFDPPECIALNRNGIVLWNKAQSSLRLYDQRGMPQQEIKLEGTPIPSSSSIHRFWVQNGPKIQCWEWAFGNSKERPDSGLAVALLVHSASRELMLLDKKEAVAAADEILKNTRAFLEFVDAAIAVTERGDWLHQTDLTIERLVELKTKMASFQERFYRPLQRLGLSIMQLHWACAVQTDGIASSHFLQAKQLWQDLSEPICRIYAELVQRADNLFVLMEGFLKGAGLCADASDIQRNFFAQMELECRSRVALVRGWSRFRYELDASLPHLGSTIMSANPANNAQKMSPITCCANPPSHVPCSGFLREVDRISLHDFSDISPIRPSHITSDIEGTIYVSAFGAHAIYCMDARGRLLNILGKMGTNAGEFRNPTGVVIDSLGHLWVSDAGNRRLQLFDIAHNENSLLVLSEGFDIGWPGGLCAFGSNSILLADTLKYRVYKIYFDGHWEILCDRTGIQPGEIRHPNSFCSDTTDPSGSVWLVDQKNNRLQRINPSGHFSQVLGGANLEKGGLLSPRSAAMFPDGVLVVAQEWFPELKIFSREGVEIDRLSLDYSPGGMLVHDGYLLVCQTDGDNIRIYQRI